MRVGTLAAGSVKHCIAATLRSIQGVKRCTKSRTARALTPTGTTISPRPPPCTRAVSRRARALTRTANASPVLRAWNSDSCVPSAFIAYDDTRFDARGGRARLALDQQRQLFLRRFIVGRHDQGLLDPVTRAEHVAARRELRAEREIRLGVAPPGHVRARRGRLLEQLGGLLQGRKRPLILRRLGLGPRELVHGHEIEHPRVARRELEGGPEPLLR